MTIEDEFAELMIQTILVEHPSAAAKTLYGRGGYDPGVSYRARVVGQDRILRDDAGKEQVSRTKAYVFGAPGITTTCRVTLPDGSQPVILHVDRFPDEAGDHHEVLHFGTNRTV